MFYDIKYSIYWGKNRIHTKYPFYDLSFKTGSATEDELFAALPDIGPRIDMKSLPGLFLPEEPLRNTGLKGHLLSPKEGCGTSKVGAPRIVGGLPAKNGAYPWMGLLGFKMGQQISFKCGT